MAATTESQDAATPFSLALSDDQRDIRSWVHGFAESVVRPAAHQRRGLPGRIEPATR